MAEATARNKIRIGVIDSGIDREFLRVNRINLGPAAQFEIDFDKKVLESNT